MGDGLVDEAWWRGRQDDYLEAATAEWVPASIPNVLDHLERRHRDPSHAVDLDSIGETAQARWFHRIDNWLDVADFDMTLLAHVLWTHGDELPDLLRTALEDRFVGFKYWYLEPTPEGVVDERWYWSENHRLLFHTLELLAGERFGERTFTHDGTSGEEHRQRAEARLHAWFDEKATDGFSEWHSDVYYEKDLAPLITLAELARDEALAARATAFLDLLLFDLALHQHRGNLGCTHGRSYAKDKTKATDQLTFSAVKLCFDTTDEPYRLDRPDDIASTYHQEGASLLARARRYRPPEVIRRVAVHPGPFVDREGMGIELDPTEPLTDHPTRADGLSYTDPDMVPFWWDRSALTPWQLVGLTMDTLDRHDLWEAQLFAAFKAVRDVTGGDREITRKLAHDLAPIVNAGLLTRVETTVHRSAHAMLSSAQSYRPGWGGYQHHAWQATLDERAVVFTTHPANEPWPGTDEWVDADRYWTGSGSLPRCLQHGTASIVQYAPAFDSPELDVLAAFGYLPFTHAFFPTERFDEVLRDGHWTTGRRRDGYVALWSWRPVEWRHHDPATHFTDGMTEPFDLVAEGGATNVWIVQIGDVDTWGSFEAFCDAATTAAVQVTDLGPADGGGHAGFDVVYHSPSEGTMACSWTGPLRVDGAEVATAGYPRFDNPFAQVPTDDPTVRIADGDWSLELDLRDGARRPAGP